MAMMSDSSEKTQRAYSNQALPDGSRVQEYRILGLLGTGAFGIVYKAENTFFSDIVAIKEFMPSDLACRKEGTTVVPISSDTEAAYHWALDKFLVEAKILWQLAHPEPHRSIVRVLQFIEANDTAYMVMDYEEGRPLSDILEERNTLPEEELKGIIDPLLDGLEKVHNASVWHRDIKPSNILIRPDGSPVLIDFGAARWEKPDSSRSMMAIFSPAYAAPEQMATVDEQQGAWTDIYSLGATIYRAVTGAPPTNASERVLGTPYTPALQAVQAGYSTDFLAWIDSALHLKIENRPQTVAEWRLQLMDEEDFDKTIVRPLDSPSMPIAPEQQTSSTAGSVETTTGRSEQQAEQVEKVGIWGRIGTKVQNRIISTAIALVLVVLGYFFYSTPSQPPPPGPSPAFLKVTIIPADAIQDGARWAVGDGPWQVSSSELSLEEGLYRIRFMEIEGWERPADIVNQIGAGDRHSLDGLYRRRDKSAQPLSFQTASLTVTIMPKEAAMAGGQWRLEGGTWKKSAETISLLEAGSQSILFKEIPGWKAPSPQKVDIKEGKDHRERSEYLKLSLPEPVPPPIVSEVSRFKTFFTSNGKERELLEGSELSHKEEFYFRFIPERPVFLYVAQVDAAGLLFTIFPNRVISSAINPLEAGKKYLFPEAEGFRFHFDPKVTGQEWFYLIASQERVFAIEEIFGRLGEAADPAARRQLAQQFLRVFEKQNEEVSRKFWFYHQ